MKDNMCKEHVKQIVKKLGLQRILRFQIHFRRFETDPGAR